MRYETFIYCGKEILDLLVFRIYHWIFAFVLLCLMLPGNVDSSPLGIPKAEHGRLNLKDWDFAKNGQVKLDGEWEFYWRHLLEPKDCTWGQKCLADKNVQLIPVPFQWQKHKLKVAGKKQKLPAYGYASYRLQITLPNKPLSLAISLQDIGSSYRLFINGNQIWQKGVIATDSKNSRPFLQYKTIDLPPLHSNKLDIILHVANFHYHKAGIYYPLALGLQDTMTQQLGRSLALEITVCSALFIMGLYHFGLYLNRRKEPSPLYFGIYCLLISLRILVIDNRMILYLFPSLPFVLIHKLEYLSFYYGSFVFTQFVASLFREEFSKRVLQVLTIVILPFVFAVIALPMVYYSKTLRFFQLSVLLGIGYVVYVTIKAILNKQLGSKLFMSGLLLFFLALINEIFFSMGVSFAYPNMVSYGLLVFILFQASVLSRKFAAAFHEIEVLSDSLISTNRANSKFVPSEFLEILGKKDITHLRLGDQRQTDMTVLFSDIRSFTTLSEQMSAKENFDFINSYLKRMGPIIRKNHGFIDKYIGDAIMALFHQGTKDALQAAISMQEQLLRYNQTREKTGQPTIQIGIGIHSGRCMLGIIGEKERIESTVISDTVNLAARIESLTKVYGAGIVLTGTAFAEVSGNTDLHYRILDTVIVKGKTSEVTIYEIFNGLAQDKLEVYLTTKTIFEQAIIYYRIKKFSEAIDLLQEVQQKNPEDKAVRVYLERCELALKHGVHRDWHGVYKFYD
ncbi:MAG: adenylate/guanylate cyclase domain-containing protein [Spirochaetota bacterium]